MTLVAEPSVATQPATVCLTVLLVSEDPETIFAVQRALKPAGVRVVGCTGPVQAPCYLDEYHTCPFAEHADVAVVDVPDGGEFTRFWQTAQAGPYAERLARRHPHCFVVVTDGEAGRSGPMGEVAHVRDLQSAVQLIWSMATHPARRAGRVVPLRRKEHR